VRIKTEKVRIKTFTQGITL